MLLWSIYWRITSFTNWLSFKSRFTQFTAHFNPLLHKTPNTPTFWMHLTPECAYLLNAYDATKAPRLIHHPWPQQLRANRRRATSNTSPDSPSNGESGKVFGVALHLFVTKLVGSWVMNQPWHICGVICIQKVGAFRRRMHSEGMCIWCFMQQRVNTTGVKGNLSLSSSTEGFQPNLRGLLKRGFQIK